MAIFKRSRSKKKKLLVVVIVVGAVGVVSSIFALSLLSQRRDSFQSLSTAGSSSVSSNITHAAGCISSSGIATLTSGIHSISSRKAPFAMPIQGEKFSIFQPMYDMDSADKDPQLLASPKSFVSTFEKQIDWVTPMVSKSNSVTKYMTTQKHAKFMYLEMMKSMVSATAFNDAELSVQPAVQKSPLSATVMNPVQRSDGLDWTYAGDTMTGWARLHNVRDLLQKVIKDNIKGDYIETGVWRGGSSVFARAVITVLGEEASRVSYVCDSFAGLPPGDKKLDEKDVNWDNTPYLEVPSQIVANNFIKYGLLDSNVIFAKGFFNETMPPLSKKIETLSIMRLDVSARDHPCFFPPPHTTTLY